MAETDTSKPSAFGIEPSWRRAWTTAVSANHRWLALALTRSWGVRSRSVPNPTRMVPGLLKLDYPSSFEDRSEFSTALRPLTPIARPPPANGMDWRIQ